MDLIKVPMGDSQFFSNPSISNIGEIVDIDTCRLHLRIDFLCSLVRVFYGLGHFLLLLS